MKNRFKTIMAMAIIAIAFAACKKKASEPAGPTNKVTFEIFADPEGAVYVYLGAKRTELNAANKAVTLNAPLGKKIYLRRLKGTPMLKVFINDVEFAYVDFVDDYLNEYLIEQ